VADTLNENAVPAVPVAFPPWRVSPESTVIEYARCAVALLESATFTVKL
jgi:hypothetical protein